MYSAGKSSPQKRPSQQYLLHAMDDSAGHCTSTEVLQEILYRYSAIGALETGIQIFDLVVSLGITVFPVEEVDVLRARSLLETHRGLSVRDVVHLGVMKSRGIETIVSYDRGFSVVPGIKRIEP